MLTKRGSPSQGSTAIGRRSARRRTPLPTAFSLMSLYLGLVLALLSALAANLAALYKHRGACRATSVDVRRPLRSAGALWRQRCFAVGMLVGGVAWVFHVGALSLAPLSLVQAVISGGVVLLAVLADRFFGIEVSARQWTGLGLTAVGLILLGVSLPNGAASHDATFSGAALTAFELGLFAVGGLLIIGPRLGGPAEHHGLMIGASAGILFGVGSVAIKALATLGQAEGPMGVVSSPWLVTAMAASVIAFYASARSLQDGAPVAVIAITGTAANVVGIAGGIIVFGDPFPSDAVGIVAQASAFVFIVVAAALIPGSRRGAGTPPVAATA